MTTSLIPLVPLAKELDENKVTPGVLGFAVFAVIGLAVWLLMKNMNKQFTKIDFEERPKRGDESGDGEEVGGPRGSADPHVSDTEPGADRVSATDPRA